MVHIEFVHVVGSEEKAVLTIDTPDVPRKGDIVITQGTYSTGSTARPERFRWAVEHVEWSVIVELRVKVYLTKN